MLNKKKNLFFYFSYVQAFFFLILLILNKMFENPKFMFNSFFYPHGKEYFLLSFVLWLLLTLYTHLILILSYKESTTQQKKQIKSLLLAAPLGFGAGTLNFLLPLNINIYPYSNFLIPIYVLIITYGILRHQLLDIVIVIRRGLVYSISIAILTLSYLTIVIVLEKLIQQIFGYHSTIVSIFTAFSVGLLFIPLRNKIQYIVDRVIFRGTAEEMAFQVDKLKEVAAETEKYKSMAIFSAGVAHEIKNPLAAINTFCEFLPKKIHSEEFLNNFSKIVGDQVRRINDFVNQLSEYGKPSPLVMKPTDIHKLIRDTTTLFSSQCLDKKIQIKEHFEIENVILTVDSSKIHQAFINIIKNAIEAMPEGGTLTLETELKDFSTPFLKIVVGDTGCGILSDQLPHIFDPFFSQKDQGTG